MPGSQAISIFQRPLGERGPILVKRDVQFSQDRGWSLDELWMGGIYEMLGFLPQLEAANYSYSLKWELPVWEVTATKVAQTESDDQVIHESYSIHTETVSQDIWSGPIVSYEVDRWTAAHPGQRHLYRKYVEQALKKEDPSWLSTKIDPEAYPFSQLLYTHLAAGADSWETEYFVLTQTKRVGIQYRGSIALDYVSRIYTTAQLNSVFGVPPEVVDLLPLAGDSPVEDTVWGWRQRRYSIDYSEVGAADLTQDFAFAQWLTWLYPIG